MVRHLVLTGSSGLLMASRVVAVDGPSGAGKTTYAAWLSDALGGAPVVHMDDLYPGWQGLEDAVLRLREGVLEPLRRGFPARYRRYDWTAGRDGPWQQVPTAPVTVVEGSGSGALACAPFLSMLVWVEADLPVRYARAMARDGEGYRPYWDDWAAQEQEHFAANRTRRRSDVLVRTDPTGHTVGS